MADCLACAAARPSLGTVPFPFNAHNNPRGQRCMYKLYGQKSPADCVDIAQKYPVVKINDIPPDFTSYEGLYDCITRDYLKGTEVGTLKWCNSTTILSNQDFLPGITMPIRQYPRTDVWWYCGTKTLYSVLPQDWTGTCALVQLVMPFYAVPMTAEQLINMAVQPKATRAKRSVFPGSFDSTVYIDSIGVPRGVPDEFKARNQILAGLESIFLWPTINKNVDWINYIYYNQQRFINHSKDAMKGLSEQLDKTSQMSLQNRVALDMLLAGKGGVCKMFGTLCCTFIPNNTSPDGSVTKALKGLTTLSMELADNSGIEMNPLGGFLDGWLGKYKDFLVSGLMSVSGVIVILALCCCCFSTCIRAFANRLINGALNQEYARGQYHMGGQFPMLAEQDDPPPYTDVDENDELV
ncbi:syncytin-A-like [Gymnodraco acuticeps]|uniref:Syncytin-A-like n=1 Tax=Gymnodraco acuticeps TaxID=8218 RepID=A0A6P8W9W6_GYMAC|nr:syncytin-A-like [Gymnodraco acuticeps]